MPDAIAPTRLMADASIVYTAVTFAPVQGFIEKSRKLRDLYGSSFILSYLAREICLGVDESRVISPAQISLTQGTPNQILIRDDFPRAAAKAAFDRAWRRLVDRCRNWVQQELSEFEYEWGRDWDLWASHAWEFFWATGSSLQAAFDNLHIAKQSRAWVGVNWTGESSTLSGADAIAWHGMGRIVSAQERSLSADDAEITRFYQALNAKLASVVGKVVETEETQRKEFLSIPEMVKRLVTYDAVTGDLQLPDDQRPSVEIPRSFRDLNRFEASLNTGWFKGDGDRMGKYLNTLSEQERTDFSRAIRHWGREFKKSLPYPEQTERRSLDPNGRIIYAGGDDFMGVLYRQPPSEATEAAAFHPLTASECIAWFQQFPRIWGQHGYPITASVGFVWAAPKVPQRDVLQHCDAAESSAKRAGRDRIALRVLFNSGNHLEWICPWRFLPVLHDYRDPQDGESDWVHFYNDAAVLEARHAFEGKQAEVAAALLRVYFDRTRQNSRWTDTDRQTFYDLFDAPLDFSRSGWWNVYEGEDPDDSTKNLRSTGILGDRRPYLKDKAVETERVTQAINTWIINLAKIGFHLCSSTSSASNR